VFDRPDELTTRDLIGLGFWAIEEQLHRLRKEIRNMALDLTQLTADVSADTDAVNSATTLLNTLAQEIRDNQNNPAALDALATQLETNTANLAAAVTANTNPTGTTAPPPPAFVDRVSGESYVDYQARVAAWNADTANSANQVVELSETDWNAIPVAPPIIPEVVDPTNLNNTPVGENPSDPNAAGTATPTPEPTPVDVPPADVPPAEAPPSVDAPVNVTVPDPSLPA
jgi:hypothetical protein